jgi:hypothetical protein
MSRDGAVRGRCSSFWVIGSLSSVFGGCMVRGDSFTSLSVALLVASLRVGNRPAVGALRHGAWGVV